MPTLNWIGKDAVVKHHNDVPYRLLEPVPALSLAAVPSPAAVLPPPPAGEGRGGGEPAIDPYQGNLIVQGDNLQALKALLPHYGGKVKCIYIDPPYNTGNEGWAYNDNVNSPEIRRWLGEVVGKEGDTLDRHDRWLCMMYPRLMLLKKFLSDDGVILVSLDDIEIGNLRILMDEIFGFNNRIATIVWNTRNTDNRIQTNLSPDHEYILVYGKTASAKIEGRVIDRSNFTNPDNDPRGPYVTDPLKGKATATERPNLHDYAMEEPGTSNLWRPDPAKGWITNKAGYEELLKQSKIWWPPNPKTGWPRKKRFLSETQERMPASSFWTEFKTQSGARELDDVLDERVFSFPKPTTLVQRIVSYCVPPDSFILDSFAGSGTTAHAVLKQNAEDGGNRRFILVEIDEGIARDVTAERVRRVAKGYTNAKGQAVEGLGGSFHFCKLGQQLFDARGHIDPNVRFGDLARFVWFQETGQPLSPPGRKGWSPLLGVHRGRAVYLLYNGILKDRAIDGGNVLTSPLLAELPAHDGPRVVYGARCVIGADRLRRLDIAFKQLPYDLRVSR